MRPTPQRFPKVACTGRSGSELSFSEDCVARPNTGVWGRTFRARLRPREGRVSSTQYPRLVRGLARIADKLWQELRPRGGGLAFERLPRARRFAQVFAHRHARAATLPDRLVITAHTGRDL